MLMAKPWAEGQPGGTHRAASQAQGVVEDLVGDDIQLLLVLALHSGGIVTGSGQRC